MSLFSAIKVDLNASARPLLLPALAEHFTATNEGLRVDSVRAFQITATRVSDPSVFVGMAEDVAKLFTSNLQPAQKVGILNGIEALLQGAQVPEDAIAKAADKVVAVVAPVVEKDANDDAKSKGLRVIGQWSGWSSKLGEAIVKLIAATLKSDKEALRSAAADAAAFTLTRTDKAKIAQITPWVDTLVQIVKAAKSAKAAEIGSPVAALRALVRLATLESTVGKYITEL